MSKSTKKVKAPEVSKSTAEVIAEVNASKNAALASANWKHRSTNDMWVINATSNVVAIPEPTPKAIPEVKTPKDTKDHVDITAIVALMPETFTPALLDKLLKLNDGGKTVRRHLRKYFAAAQGHEHKDKWVFTTKSDLSVIQYFADRYSADMTVLIKKAS
jgi:hypothetical protein